MTRHISNPSGMADLARIIAALDVCETCGGIVQDRDTSPDCPDCLYERLAYVEQPSDRERRAHRRAEASA